MPNNKERVEIDFIKWMVGYADGFDWEEEHLRVQEAGKGEIKDWINNIVWVKIYYPLLLQRAIEGVNRNSVYNKSDSKILSNLYVYEAITKNGSELFDIDWSNPVKAKEAALMYIWEQENAK